MLSKNKIIGITGLIISMIYGYGITKLRNPSDLFMAGTTVFPILITIGAVIFSIAIIAQDYMSKDKVEYLKLDPKVMKTMGIFTAIFAVYITVFNKIGFLLSTIAMLLSLLFIFNIGKSQYKINAIIGILFPTLCYVLFAKIFAISLPRGIMPF